MHVTVRDVPDDEPAIGTGRVYDAPPMDVNERLAALRRDYEQFQKHGALPKPKRLRPVRSIELCIDVVDPRPVAAFWTRFLGYTVAGDPDARWVHLEPAGRLPVLNLQTVPEKKRGKNRLHLDVFVDDPEGWIDYAKDLGAKLVSTHDTPDDWFCVMHDPAGNEFCICRENE